MPITRTCPTCGGSGVQTLGMSFEEAVNLALRIGTAGNLFTVRELEALNYRPSEQSAWIVRAGHLLTGGTTVTFTSPEQFEQTDWLHWSPLSHKE